VLEFWERFSYYGVLAILVLFLTAPGTTGGFGWSDSRALNLLAIFSAGAFTLPVIGGFVADRCLGARRSVMVGALLLVGGNVALAVAALHGSLAGLGMTPRSGELALFLGILLIALGNGFFKSALVTLIGNLLGSDDAARDQAFRYYYQAIMLGALSSSLLIGAAAETIGWWGGFAIAAVGMAVSWVILVSMDRRDLLDSSRGEAGPDVAESMAPSGSNIAAIAVFCAFLPVIAVGWLQFYGLWMLEVERHADRAVGAFTVPASWMVAVNAIAIVIMAPLVGRWWRRLAAPPAQAPGFAAQLAVAFVLMSVAHVAIAWAFRDASTASVWLGWPIFCLLMVTLAEAVFWPSSYNVMHRLHRPGARA
jgi:POT family proton-dependent oligopeptide transporter